VGGGVEVVRDGVQVEAAYPDVRHRRGQRQHVRELVLVDAERGRYTGHGV
jgi:hypothetical protein